MDILSQIALAIRTAAHSVTGANPQVSGDPAAASARLLKAAQQRVNRLNSQLSQAEAREQTAEQAWRDARAQADALELEVNAAVNAGQDDVARAKLALFNQAQNRTQQLSDRWHNYATAAEKLRLEIRELQAQLDAARKRMAAAGTQAAPAAQPAATGQPAVESETRQVRLEQPPDNAAAAGGNLDQTRIADLLKKRDQ